MSKIRFSAAAIKAGFLVENPDWYIFEITKNTEKPSNSGDSLNHFLTFEGRSGEMEGVPVTVLMNSKAEWVSLPLFTAANNGVPPTEDTELDWDDLVGVKLRGYCKRGERFGDGTPCNVITEFRPLEG